MRSRVGLCWLREDGWESVIREIPAQTKIHHDDSQEVASTAYSISSTICATYHDALNQGDDCLNP